MTIRAPPPVQIPTLDPVQVCGSTISSTRYSRYEDPTNNLLNFCAGATNSKICAVGKTRGLPGTTRICSPVPIDKRSPWGANSATPRRDYVPTPKSGDQSRNSQDVTKVQPLSHKSTADRKFPTVYTSSVKTATAIPRFPSAHRSQSCGTQLQPTVTPVATTRKTRQETCSSSGSVGQHPTTQPRRSGSMTFSRSVSNSSVQHEIKKRTCPVNSSKKFTRSHSQSSTGHQSNTVPAKEPGVDMSGCGSIHHSRNGIFTKPASYSSKATIQNLANQIVVNTASDLRITALEKENSELRQMIEAAITQISLLQEDNLTMKSQIAEQHVAFSVWVDSFNKIVKTSADNQNDSVQYESCPINGMCNDESPPLERQDYTEMSPDCVISISDTNKGLDDVARCLEMNPQETTPIL